MAALVAHAGEPTLPGMPRLPRPTEEMAARWPVETSMPDAVADSPTLSRIAQGERIVLGYRQTAVPFSYVDAHDAPTGLAWALCARVVAALQRSLNLPTLRITPVRVIEQMRAPMVKGEAIDIDCAPSTVTAERSRQVAFSLPYYASDVRLLVRRGSGIDGIAQLRGLRLAVVQGTTAERLVRARHAQSGFQLLMARDYDDAFRMLGAHRAQALALDEVLLEGLRATSKTPGAFEIVGSPLADQPERYALVLPNDDPVFKAHVDAALAELFRSGDMAHLQKTWLQTRVPPHGHELHVEPSEDVLALWQEGGDLVE